MCGVAKIPLSLRDAYDDLNNRLTLSGSRRPNRRRPCSVGYPQHIVDCVVHVGTAEITV